MKKFLVALALALAVFGGAVAVSAVAISPVAADACPNGGC